MYIRNFRYTPYKQPNKQTQQHSYYYYKCTIYF